MKKSSILVNITKSQPRFLFSSSTVLFFDILLLTLFCSSVLILALNNAGAMTFDEFYHFLAARSWAENGTLAIGDGAYLRGSLFTKALGVVFAYFGESINVARIVPVLGGIAWALIVFLWSRFFLGRFIAWIAVMMFIFSNVFLGLSTYIRFYSWHGFFVFSAFALGTLYLSQSRKNIYSNFILILAIVSILLAYHLQESTLIAIVAFSCFLILFYHDFIKKILVAIFTDKRYLFLSFSLLTAIAIVCYSFDIPQIIWTKYSHSALWATKISKTVYHWYFKTNYPLLWSIFPMTAVWAAVYRPPYGLACAVIFSVCFLLHSFAGMRDIRYLAYALPFFFIIGSIAVVGAIKSLKAAISVTDYKYLKSYLTLHGLTLPIISFVTFITFSFAIIVNDGFRDAYDVMLGKNSTMGADWSAYSQDLKRLANSVDVVVVTYSVAGIYFIGDIDFVMSPTIIMETDTQEEFGYDSRIGRRVISSLDSLKLIMECYSSGLIVVDQRRWGDPLLGTDSTTNKFLIENTSPVSLVDDKTLHAFTWKKEISTGNQSDCARIQSPPR